jgi:hypothetical protein
MDHGDISNSGAAFVVRSSYDETTETWTITEQSKLTASEPSLKAEFGWSVAISGNTVVVGAHKNEAVYVFNYDGFGWDEEAKLGASDAQGGERFGSSVAIDGDTLVVGAINGGEGDVQTGSAYVFEYNGSDWEEKTELFADVPAYNDQFGYSVAIEGDTIIVGAPRHDESETDSGAAYVFRRNAGTWIPEAKLTGSGLFEKAYFGSSVALSGNTAVVGAYKNDLDVGGNPLVDAGSAYVFRFEDSKWQEKQKLIPAEAGGGEEFGWAVAISGDTAVVGAHKDANLSGSAYVFTLTPEIQPQNQPPVADAGENLEVEEGSLFTLRGSGSDLDYDELTYKWEQTYGPTVMHEPSDTPELTLEAPSWSAENHTLIFQLVVNDGKEDSEPALVEITVLQSTKSVTEISSVLGWKHRPWGIDKDIYTFHGTEGQKVTVALRAKSDGKNNNGKCATLKLKDNIRGISFYRIDSGRLPNQICATLPATGEYHILVAGQPRFRRGKRFSGEYILTLEGVSGGLQEGAGSSVDHKKSRCSAKTHKEHPIWNWIFSRFRH